MSKPVSEKPSTPQPAGNSGRYIFAFLALSVLGMLAIYRCDFDLSSNKPAETNSAKSDSFQVSAPLDSHPRFELTNLRISVVNEQSDEEYRIDWKITNGKPIPDGIISLLVRLPDDSMLQLPADEIRFMDNPTESEAIFFGTITKEDLADKQTKSLSQGCEFFVAYSSFDNPQKAYKLSNSLIQGDMQPLQPLP